MVVARGAPKSAFVVAAPYVHFQVSRSLRSSEVFFSLSGDDCDRTGFRQPATGPFAHVGGGAGRMVTRTVPVAVWFSASFTWYVKTSSPEKPGAGV